MRALLITASLCLAAAPAMARDADPNIDAVWVPQVVSFTYQSNDTFYTCNGLWQKVTGILAHLGARKTAAARQVTCADFAHVVQLQIALESPAVATEETLLALTAYDSEDMLVARVRGTQLPSAEDIPRFPAAWTTLTLRSPTMSLTAGDCELVHQLRKQVLPKLSVQVVNEPSRCNNIARGMAPKMTVRALTVSG